MHVLNAISHVIEVEHQQGVVVDLVVEDLFPQVGFTRVAVGGPHVSGGSELSVSAGVTRCVAQHRSHMLSMIKEMEELGDLSSGDALMLSFTGLMVNGSACIEGCSVESLETMHAICTHEGVAALTIVEPLFRSQGEDDPRMEGNNMGQRQKEEQTMPRGVATSTMDGSNRPSVMNGKVLQVGGKSHLGVGGSGGEEGWIAVCFQPVPREPVKLRVSGLVTAEKVALGFTRGSANEFQQSASSHVGLLLHEEAAMSNVFGLAEKKDLVLLLHAAIWRESAMSMEGVNLVVRENETLPLSSHVGSVGFSKGSANRDLLKEA
ncbi:hypothetical protein NE237_007471 [Protea cynaroides]|uniref:Uncharacterized protein n=1 Tax=Protea cynaroides TaxID=273540 RepID=A0A9Q0KPG2_9MAGN|nr:hypothetical protein NE237_007471 [Protea cynaroides]